jgi:serine/threonine protein kinase
MSFRLITDYTKKQLIGKGGMGDVYRATHARLERPVAIKLLKSEFTGNQSFRNRFRNEAKVMAKLQHPGIVALYDFYEEEDQLFIIMEYAEGMALDDFMASKGGKLEEDTAVKIMLNILEAMEYAHRKNVIHRDIKPSNIMVKEDLSIKILDFGIAKLMEEAQNHHLTQTKGAVGTVYYMSPEQIKVQPLTPQTDIYSLGVVFYYMLEGNLPYSHIKSEFEIQKSIVEKRLPILSNKAEEINILIQSMTNKSINERINSCSAAIKNLTNTQKKPSIIKFHQGNKESFVHSKLDRSDRRYYFINYNEEYGPFSIDEIEKQVNSGITSPACFVRRNIDKNYDAKIRIIELIK